MEDRHLPLSTVAGRLGVSERTVRRWIKAGKLKAYRPGRDYRIPESALRALVEESEIDPKAEAPPPPTLFNNAREERRDELMSSFTELVEAMEAAYAPPGAALEGWGADELERIAAQTIEAAIATTDEARPERERAVEMIAQAARVAGYLAARAHEVRSRPAAERSGARAAASEPAANLADPERVAARLQEVAA